MIKRLFILAVTVLSIASFNAQAVEPPKFPGVEKLSFMVGKWQGPSWMQTREGRVDSEVKESVSCKWDCEIMLIEGVGTKPSANGGVSTVVHSAFGIIRFDPETKQFVMQAYAKGRGMVEAPITMTGERSFQWQMALPHNSGWVRYTVDFTEDGKWKEFGEYSRDGKSWFKTMEMTLTRS